MFLGHFSLALASKRAAPKLNLGLTFAACQALDLLWPMLVLAGVEKLAIRPGLMAMSPMDFQSYPYSHGLAAVLTFSLAAYALARWAFHHTRRESLVLGLLVLSHWFLDVIVHRPDLPLLGDNGPKVGLGAWNSMPLTLLLEFGSFAAGVWLYTRATRPRTAGGLWGFWTLILFLMVVMLGAMFGPAPTEAKQVAASALSMWLLLGWAGWADARRVSR